MTFNEACKELEQAFERQVAKDNKRGLNESIFLPHIRPAGPADFVLVGMEPSLGRWASNRDEARKKIERGFKNFTWSAEDFILHFCIKNYLCTGGRTYYITDLSKGAMLVREAADQRRERYEKWYPLLKKELQVVAKPGAPIISIGQEAGNFLSKNGLCGHKETILHYSAQTAGHRGEERRNQPNLYDEFSPTVGWQDIEQTVRRVMAEGEMCLFVDDILKRLRRGSRLTESRKELMFNYKVRFDTLAKEPSCP